MKKVLLRIKNISKDYSLNKKKIKHALINIEFDLFEGEIFGLLGVNGAGKTTLSSIIATLHPPTTGSLEWEGYPVDKNLYAYRKIVGFCPQQKNLDANLTVEKNLIFQGRYYGMNPSEIRARSRYLLERFELTEYAQSTINVLSGGYQQRFLIARTLMHNPKLIILDEPTVGLDPQVRHKLWNYILELKQEGISVLLTTHYLDEAEMLSDRVCVIDKGKIKVIESPEKLKINWNKKNLEEVFLHLLQGES
ncbi:MAG: ABC transporter ATP-binding protein [Parachlamydiales bacterium]|nr:ABC transporter ATP-binding protein [Parachlamydiales bacterium]